MIAGMMLPSDRHTITTLICAEYFSSVRRRAAKAPGLSFSASWITKVKKLFFLSPVVDSFCAKKWLLALKAMLFDVPYSLNSCASTTRSWLPASLGCSSRWCFEYLIAIWN